MERREPHGTLDPQALVVGYRQAVDRFLVEPIGTNLAAIIEGESRLVAALQHPGKFPLGHVVATPAALAAMERAHHIPPEFLVLHKHGHWGELDPEDVQANEDALLRGSRLLSAYTIRRGARLWAITEWNRSATTLLLPEDY